MRRENDLETMASEVDLYDGHYGQLATDLQGEVRRETYEEDLGQASWITGVKAREWFDLLQLGPGRTPWKWRAARAG